MTFFALLALSFALAMDAFAVAVTTGLRLQCITMPHTLRMAGTFGFFQFAMPVAGWFLGIGAQRYIENYDHWLAFALLLFVGGKMLKEAWENRGKSIEECTCADPTQGKSLVLLGVATSLDALAVGLSMAILGTEVWGPALVIGVICFAVTAAGMHLGRYACNTMGADKLGNKANALGGLVLIFIGLNILHEHGVF